MPTSAPRVTVLLPVYNAVRYAADALRSVLTQSFTNFEVLVLDDGSTDGSADVVGSFDDPRVRLVRAASNVGLTPTLNRGLALARGELIARQDADDVSEPTRLERQVACLDANPEVAVVGSWYIKIDASGESLGDRHLPVRDTALRWALLSYCPIVHSAATFRRQAILALGGYDEQFAYAQDYDLWSRVARHHRLGTVSECLVRYRVLPTSLTATIGDRSGEGPAIAHANGQALLRGAGREPIAAADYADACSVLLGARLPLGSARMARAFANAAELVDAFSAQRNVAGGDVAEIRTEVRRLLRRRLVDSFDDLDPDDVERVARLLFDDSPWVALLRSRVVRAMVASIGRSRFAAP